WRDRPPPPQRRAVLHDLAFAGESAAAKLKRIGAELARLRADCLIVSDPHNVAWAFNIRGADLPHTPVALAFAAIPREGRAVLYVDGTKLDDAVRRALEEVADIREPRELVRDLADLRGKIVRL